LGHGPPLCGYHPASYVRWGSLFLQLPVIINVGKCYSVQNTSIDVAEIWPQSLSGKGRLSPHCWSWPTLWFLKKWKIKKNPKVEKIYQKHKASHYYTVSGKKSLQYFRYIFDKHKLIFIIFCMTCPEYSLPKTVEIFSLHIGMSLRTADVIMTSLKNVVFIVSEVKKANSISVNNFNKFKCMIIISCRQCLEKQHATDNVLIAHFA